MYVAKRLSSLRRNPHTLSQPPQEGPYSGILVIQERDDEDQEVLCCGLSDEISVRKLPFPQNKMIRIWTADDSEYVMMIPVVDQPLAFNVYYVIKARFSHTGEAFTCSTPSNGMRQAGLFSQQPRDVKPRPFDPKNIYQHFKFVETGKQYPFYAQSLAPDGRVPSFMTSNSRSFTTTLTMDWLSNLSETDGEGLNVALRKRLPHFEFSTEVWGSESVVVGRWYVPFIFVKEGGVKLKDQMRRSMYYKMSLEQRWERIFEAENDGREEIGKVVSVDVCVRSEAVVVGGREVVEGGGRVVDGVMWYGNNNASCESVGMSLGIVERMKREDGRGGWIDMAGKEVRVKRVEEHGHGSGRGWRRFGCYMLVERFLLRRMDGSLVLSYSFYHTHEIRAKWE